MAPFSRGRHFLASIRATSRVLRRASTWLFSALRKACRTDLAKQAMPPMHRRVACRAQNGGKRPHPVGLRSGGPLMPNGLRVGDAGNLATQAETPVVNRDLIREATRAVLKASAVP